MIRFLVGMIMVAVASIAILVVGNAVTWVLDRLLGWETDHDFLGRGLAGALFLVVLIAVSGLAYLGAWWIGGLIVK